MNNDLEKMKNIWLDYFQPHIEKFEPVEYILTKNRPVDFRSIGTGTYRVEGAITFLMIINSQYNQGWKKIKIINLEKENNIFKIDFYRDK